MKRQRADGSWTFTTVDWDHKWYWPIGTRIAFQTANGLALGTVTKTNNTTVRVQFDLPRFDAAFRGVLIPMKLLERVVSVNPSASESAP